MLELKTISKKYHVNTSQVVALDNVNLSVKQGEFVVVLGRSGSGKSTLLSLMAGLERPSNGKLFHNQKELNRLTEDKKALWRRDNIGIIFQHFNLMDSMTAVDNIELPLLISRANRNG